MTPEWQKGGGGGNRGCCVYISKSGIPANEAGTPVAKTRQGPIKIKS